MGQYAGLTGQSVGHVRRRASTEFLFAGKARKLNGDWQIRDDADPQTHALAVSTPAPVMEITVPTFNDPALAPPGQHVLSAIVQYAPYALKEGWQGGRQRFVDAALDELERFAPGLRSGIVAAELLTPADMEREFRISGGHWHHGDLAFDQFLMVRPVPGAAQYRTPLEGLFLCGAGCHPGGGVMGACGYNAAREILRDRLR